MSISASTLLILFTADKDVRQAVFEPKQKQIKTELQSKQPQLKVVNKFQSEVQEIHRPLVKIKSWDGASFIPNAQSPHALCLSKPKAKLFQIQYLYQVEN